MNLKLDFENSLADSSWDASRMPRYESIRIVFDEIRQEHIAKFNWKPGERANNGFRVELCDPTLPPNNCNIYYRYSLFVPDDFNIEPDGYVVISQWHTPDSNHKPQLALRLRDTYRLDVTLNHNKVGADFPPGGSGQIKLAQLDNFKLGIWNEFEYLIRWSSQDNGAIQMRLNGIEVARRVGKTNYSDQKTAPYFKYGIYPADDNAFELNMLTGTYELCIDPDPKFLTSHRFDPDL